MGRTIDDVIAGLPADRQARIEARYAELRTEVVGLAELRRLAGLPQTVIAAGMGIRQPSISKIESQPDVFLSTLRRYVEAMGGELEIVVRLPDRSPVHLQVSAEDEPFQPATGIRTGTGETKGARRGARKLKSGA